MSNEANNRRVTNAVLEVKIDNLTELVKAQHERSEKRSDDHEQRLRDVEKKTTRLSVSHPVLSVVGALLAGWWGGSR